MYSLEVGFLEIFNCWYVDSVDRLDCHFKPKNPKP